MAPRGRHRKVGMLRIDAAVDAMEPLGFPKELVRRTVKNLLKVYGGDAGWVFIEEASYKLLIDTILEGQEEGSLKDDPSHVEARGEDDAQPSAAGSSSKDPDEAEPSAACLSSAIAGDAKPSAVGVLDDAGPSATENGILDLGCPRPEFLDTALQTNQTECKDCLPPAEGEGRSFGKVLDKKSDHNLPKKRRKRCHGWISSDDEDDLLSLTPAIPPGQAQNLICGTEKRRKRKTRWDVSPEDL